MKELIILISSIMVGIYIFNLIMGPQDSSIMASLENLWQQGIESRTYFR